MAKKRKYQNDPVEKIQQGEKWRVTIHIDDDNTKNIIREIEELGVSKHGNYGPIINKRLRQAYKK